jgi:flagellar protein FliO/FliZ
MNGASSLTPLLWLVGVVALIPLVLWMVKRSPVGASLSQGPVRTVGTLPLAAGQRLVTVEVGHGEERLWLVLGVTAQQITALHTMSPQAAAPAAAADGTPQTTFAQLLQRMQGRGPDAR